MGFYSEAKEIVNDVQEIGKDNIGAKKIVGLLKIVLFLLVCATFIVQYWKLAFWINLEVFPTFPIFLTQFLDKYTYKFFVGLIFYKFVGYAFLRYLVIRINIKLFPVLDTLEDTFEIGTLCILLLKLINNLFLCIHGVDVIKSEDKKIYLIYLICCFYWFVKGLYIKNKNYWYLADIRYTPFFDSDGKRIAQDDCVIYYGRLYKIHLLDAEECSVFIDEKRGYRKKEWYLSKCDGGIIRKEVLLEDAVRDEKGKIKVYEYGMGKRGKCDI
mgnify:CR=1 FL=1